MLTIRHKVRYKKPYNLIICPKKYLYFYRAAPQGCVGPIYRETRNELQRRKASPRNAVVDLCLSAYRAALELLALEHYPLGHRT